MSAENRHRLVYHADTGLFLCMAVPGFNSFLLEFTLSHGSKPDLLSGEGTTLVLVLLGLFGMLGAGFSWLRLTVQDSRLVIQQSVMVKIIAAAWLTYAWSAGLSSLFLLLAIMDIAAALLLISALVKR